MSNFDRQDLDAVPTGWETAPLKEVVSKLVDGSHIPPKKQERGGPMLSARNIENNQIVLDDFRYIADEDFKREHARTRIAPGDVLLTIVGSIGRSAVVPDGFQEFTLQRSVAVLTPKGLLPKYLMYQLQAPLLQRHFETVARGTAQKGVYLKTLSETPIRVAPLQQQARIVAEIEEQFTRLEAGVAALRSAQAKLKRYRAAVLKAACEGKLVPTEAELAREREKVAAASRRCGSDENQSRDGSATQKGPSYETGAQLLERILIERRQIWNGKGKYKEPVKPDSANLPSPPEGWTWARLEQLGFTYGGLTKNPKRAKLLKQLPYLRVANVYANELRLKEIEQIGVEDSELEKLLLSPNDLLVVEGNGSKDQIGRLAIWDGSINPCVHQNHLIKVRPVLSKQSKWIVYWLLSPIGRQFVEIVASSTSGLYTLSVNKVGDLPVVIPPLAEQQRIVAEVERRLSVVEELEAIVNANLQRAARLRQSILQRAFEGTLLRTDKEESSIHDESLALPAC